MADSSDEMATMRAVAFDAEDTVSVPLLEDGNLDLSGVRLSLREHRVYAAHQLVEVFLANYGHEGIRLVLDLMQYDDVAQTVCQALPDIVNSWCRLGFVENDTRKPDEATPDDFEEVFDAALFHSDESITSEASDAIIQIANSLSNPSMQLQSSSPSLATSGLGTKSRIAPSKDKVVSWFSSKTWSLFQSEWASARSSAAAMLPALEKLMMSASEQSAVEQDGTSQYIRASFTKLCSDPSVLVRRAAAKALRRWTTAVVTSSSTAEASGSPLRATSSPTNSAHAEQLSLYDYVLSCLDLFQRDGFQDSVRFNAVQQLTHVAQFMPGGDEASNRFCALVNKFSGDPSWRVRLGLAMNLSSFTRVTDAAQLVPAARNLAQDPETEVRAATAVSLGEFASSLPAPAVSLHVVSMVETLSNDSQDHVRRNVAKTVPKVWRAYVRQREDLETEADHLAMNQDSDQFLTMLTTLMRDKVESVQQEAISAIAILGTLLEEPATQKELIAVIRKAAESDRWRTRFSAAQQLRFVSMHLSPKAFQPLEPHLQSLLQDTVIAVRTASIESLGHIARHLGPAWSGSTLMSLTQILQSKSYRERHTLARCLQELLPGCDTPGGTGASSPRSGGCSNEQQQNLEPLVRSLVLAFVNDKVIAVRMALAQALSSGGVIKSTSLLSPELRTEMLAKLRNDSEEAVRAAAQESFQDAPF